MKRIGLIFGIIALLLIPGLKTYSQQKIRKVVIDAGHGGRDPGASGKNSREKDIALSIALKTGAYIKQYLPDVEVIYTRKTDVFVDLHVRANIANRNEADLFISIHCNANPSSQPYGTETYIMGLHKSQANLEVAKLENAVIFKEENYDDMYDGFNPNNDEDYITLTLFQNAYQDNSTILASKVQAQFRERVSLRDRGVHQAGFLVLYKTAMPGVLIETGYLTNARDEKFLLTEEGQVYIASAIFRAFKEYKIEMEAQNGIYTPAESSTDSTVEEKDEVIFRVQFAVSNKQKDISKFKDLEGVEEYYHNGIYKYAVGNETNLNDAVNLQNRLRKQKQYKDAFVIAFVNGERVSVKEAISKLNN
ncbi:MAG: N-acetylmuramoyl-L-alanine amidase [Bacteroidota bacterium]|nr:N-acetylmuramoyl-L-alanine amidase [Bacteroidota bacterium]